MAQAIAWSQAHACFPCFARSRGSLSLKPSNSSQTSQLKPAMCLSAPHVRYGRGRTLRGGRLRRSRYLSGFQARSETLPASLASESLSQSGARKVAQGFQDPAQPSAKPSSLKVVPAPLETKSPLPAQLEESSDAASRGAPDKAAVPGAFSDPPPKFKRCIECQRAKLLVDFKTSVNSKDGLNDNCRACLGVFRAKRAGRELGHLGLSVEEAWQRAKTCTLCHVSKEIRDYQVDRKSKDGLRFECRSCMEVRHRQLPDRSPVNHPLECDKCCLVKPASEFNICRKARMGRSATCSLCVRTRTAEAKRLRAAIYIKRERKLCKRCKESKEVSEFPRARLSVDGLFYVCRNCLRRQEASSKKGDSFEGGRRSSGTNPSDEPDV